MTRRRLSLSVIATAVLALTAVPASAQVQLQGTVADSSNRPLPGVRVTLDGGEAVSTNDAGLFTIPAVGSGVHVLRFERLGIRPRYLRVNVLDAIVSPLDVGVIVLDALVTELEEIVVQAQRYEQNIPGHRDLEQLQRAGYGHLLTPEDIDRLNPSQPEDLFRRMPGVLVGGSQVSFMGGGQISCPRGASYIVDGVQSYTLPFFGDPERQIRSVWAYRGAFDRCGVIVVETNPVAAASGSPVEVGLHAAATSRDGGGVTYDRVGMYLSIPVSARFEFYPVAEVRVHERSGWNAQLALKFLPAPQSAPVYLGGGVAVGKEDLAGISISNADVRTDPLLFGGLSLPIGPVRVSSELQLRNFLDSDRTRLAVAVGAGVRIGN